MDHKKSSNFPDINNLSWIHPAVSAFAALLALSLSLAWISSNRQSLQGSLSFMAVLLIGFLLLLGVWRLLRGEKLPSLLFILLVGAALLRLAVGVLWFEGMPRWGHKTPVEQAGYIMADAGARDQAAWELSQSELPLWTAFRGNRQVDQYGGLLFLSAVVYRYLAGEVHQPLMMVVICAAFSALSVLFTWVFARRAWGAKVAWPAAIILALYPEAVLLGSSQMREAFTITLTMVAFYGLVYYLQERSWAGLGWVLASLLLFVPLSPPFAGLLLVALALTLVSRSFAQHSENFGQRRLWLLLFILVLLAIAGSWIVLKQFTPPGMNNPFTMIGWYIRKSANLQAYLTEHASGWMQKIFDSTPEWTHIPLMVSYGVFRPFLPAAIVAGSQSLIWPWITVWRSLGWTFFLAFLIYAPWLAIVKRKNSGLIFALIAIIWVGILIASFRGGADQSDNPRYRAVFAGLQSAVVAWVWVEEKNSGGKRLRRALVAAAIVIIWFLPWYLRRYTGIPWPVEDPFITLGLGTACAGIFWLWDWARLKRRMALAVHPPDNDGAPPQ